MNLHFPRQSTRQLHVLRLPNRAPPACRKHHPRSSAKACTQFPDNPLMNDQGRRKAEGKIKGDGTWWLAGVICTGGLGGTPLRRSGAGITKSAHRHWLIGV